MSKHHRSWKIDQTQLLPASVEDYVPEDHLSRCVVSLVRESLDLAEVEASYNSPLGQPPFHPALMASVNFERLRLLRQSRCQIRGLQLER
jgi:hypothetical protein